MLRLHNGVLVSTMVPVSLHCSIKTAQSRPQEQYGLFDGLCSQLSGSTGTSVCCWNLIYSTRVSVFTIHVHARDSWKRMSSLKGIWCMRYLLTYSGIHNLDAHKSSLQHLKSSPSWPTVFFVLLAWQLALILTLNFNMTTNGNTWTVIRSKFKKNIW